MMPTYDHCQWVCFEYKLPTPQFLFHLHLITFPLRNHLGLLRATILKTSNPRLPPSLSETSSLSLFSRFTLSLPTLSLGDSLWLFRRISRRICARWGSRSQPIDFYWTQLHPTTISCEFLSQIFVDSDEFRFVHTGFCILFIFVVWLVLCVLHFTKILVCAVFILESK